MRPICQMAAAVPALAPAVAEPRLPFQTGHRLYLSPHSIDNIGGKFTVSRSANARSNTCMAWDSAPRRSRRCAMPSARRRNAYWAEQVEIQRRATAAWVARVEGRHAEAIGAMRSAADLEDTSEKHIAMENRLVPMRELLGELLLEVHEPAAALMEFEASLQRPNRFRSSPVPPAPPSWRVIARRRRHSIRSSLRWLIWPILIAPSMRTPGPSLPNNLRLWGLHRVVQPTDVR